MLEMASADEYESLDEEVKELLQNYKYKKATAYEPCTLKNFRECLIGLSEEFGLLNFSYVFNPHLDVNDNTLRPQALTNLINAVFTLLHRHKNVSQKAERLEEENHVLEHSNKQLNGLVGRLREKVNLEKNESKACVASAQRISEHSDSVLNKLTETRAKLLQVTKQKEANERKYQNEITRLKLQYEKLADRLRNKDIHTHATKASHAACMSIESEHKEKYKNMKAIISKLEDNNHMLVQEVLKLKDELIFRGMEDFSLEDQNN